MSIVSVESAIEKLNDGQVVAIPTETVYGLAARVDRPDAILKIFETKGRPFFDPLIVHVSSIEQAQGLCSSWPLLAQKLAEFFWPGPLTLVLPKSSSVHPMITSGLETVGIRSPWHRLALEIISGTGPLAAPSANRFGRTSPTQAAHVEDEYSGQVPVVDGGSCELGVESTILYVGDTELKILRPGLILPHQIEQFLKMEGFNLPLSTDKGLVPSPGSMKHHYMPSIPLVLSMKPRSPEVLRQEAQEAFQRLPSEHEGIRLIRPAAVENYVELKLSTDPRIAARELYALLRSLSQGQPDFLYLQWQQAWDQPEWVPVVDRIQKAASVVLL